jgi:hypothetical protein
MEMVGGKVMAPGGVTNSGGAEAFVIDYAGEASLTSFRFAHPDLQIDAAEAPFEAQGETFGTGSFILPAGNNPDNLSDLLENAAAEFGFIAHGVETAPDVPSHPVGVPRVAVMHTWSSTQAEGWLRVGLDEYKIPYDYISVHEARDNPNLKDRWDVIVMGPSSTNALSLVRGVQGNEPMPWMKTEVTPNLGFQNSTEDMRGGFGLQGVVNLQAFVEAGGVFVTITSSSSLPIHFGLAEGVSISTTQNLWAPGGVFRAQVADRASPLAYGYGNEMGVYFNRGPVFGGGGGGGRAGRGGGGGGGVQASDPGATTARRTGRGDARSPDIVQGRPRNMGQARVEAFQEQQRAEREAEGQAEGGGRGGAAFGAGGPGTRIIARFAADPAELLISGGLTNGRELANAPAVVDASLGEGHIVMFSFNPFWRGETLGSYAMLFNALLHHEHLGAGS